MILQASCSLRMSTVLYCVSMTVLDDFRTVKADFMILALEYLCCVPSRLQVCNVLFYHVDSLLS